MGSGGGNDQTKIEFVERSVCIFRRKGDSYQVSSV